MLAPPPPPPPQAEGHGGVRGEGLSTPAAAPAHGEGERAQRVCVGVCLRGRARGEHCVLALVHSAGTKDQRTMCPVRL